MSFFSILGKLLGLVPAVTDAITKIADAARKHDKPRDISRKHDWQYSVSVTLVCFGLLGLCWLFAWVKP